MLEPLIGRAQEVSPAEMIGLLRSSLDYDKAIADNTLPMPDDPKIANIDQLQLSAAKYGKIGHFLDHVARFQKGTPAIGNENGVRLMTIHKSKGMEFPAVFILGMVNGILPIAKGEMEEERRIAFVGMSRASQMLQLSFANSYNRRVSSRSVFLDEILCRAAETY